MKVEADVDLAKLFDDRTAQDRKFELTSGLVLFEDADLIVVSKPPGLPSHPSIDEARDNLSAAVARFLTKRDGEPPYLGIHQRLDRDTSGVMLFTKSRRVNSGNRRIIFAARDCEDISGADRCAGAWGSPAEMDDQELPRKTLCKIEARQVRCCPFGRRSR